MKKLVIKATEMTNEGLGTKWLCELECGHAQIIVAISPLTFITCLKCDRMGIPIKYEHKITKPSARNDRGIK